MPGTRYSQSLRSGGLNPQLMAGDVPESCRKMPTSAGLGAYGRLCFSGCEGHAGNRINRHLLFRPYWQKNRNCQILFFANLWYNSRKAAVILEFQVLSRPLQGALALSLTACGLCQAVFSPFPRRFQKGQNAASSVGNRADCRQDCGGKPVPGTICPHFPF